mgnify:CR=1 FL=1
MYLCFSPVYVSSMTGAREDLRMNNDGVRETANFKF